jgi:hypothetical protein
MRKKNTHLVPALAAAITVMLAVAGCGDSSPVTPSKETLVYSGRLLSRTIVPHALDLERAGTIAIELTELRAILVEVNPFDPVLRIGVGVGSFDENLACQLSIRPTFTEGLRRTLLVDAAVNCLAVFDNGTLPPDSLVAYEVLVHDESAS